MKVLITGGMGVIGSMVSSRFVEEGHRPVIMARHLDRNLVRPIEDKIDIELGDVLDLPRILSIIQTHQITHIIHTAALVGAGGTRGSAVGSKVASDVGSGADRAEAGSP